MNRNGRIITECYCDSLLIELLIRIIPNHQTNGIGGVLQIMNKHFNNQVAVGIIDNDENLKKYKASFFNEFSHEKSANNLILKKHPKRKNYLIMMSPALEKFLLAAASNCGIPKNEIPFSEKQLKVLSKSIHAGNNQKLKQFINRIIQKNPKETETLKEWIIEKIGEDF